MLGKNTKRNFSIVMLGLVAIIFIPISISGQDTYQFGALPAINLSTILNSQYSLNFSTESRQSFIQGEFNGPSTREFHHILTDIAIEGSKKIGLLSKIGIGYQIRFREGNIFHRIKQQYATISRLRSARLGHRFATDQTFSQDRKMEIRARYRITAEFPLSGDVVDPTEFYFKVNNEYLNSFQGDEHDFEIRLLPAFGYSFTDINKLESGIEYRINSFIGGNPAHRFWFRLNWYVRI